MLRKFVVWKIGLAAAAAALCTVSASAQSSGGGQSTSVGIPFKGADRPLTEEEIERRKANDRAYEAAVQKIPDKKTSADPWGEIRPTSPAKKKQQ